MQPIERIECGEAVPTPTGAVFTPVFNDIPAPLKNLPRWVVWKGRKIPFSATALDSPAKVNDPGSWATFDQAQTAYEEGGYQGVGIVLNGDGLVGIDLDKCVRAGVPEPAALNLMQRINCGYVEVSPSGTGLRGFGYVDGDIISGTKGTLDGLNVELYGNNRYLTVTGRPLVNQPLGQLQGVAELVSEVRGNHLQRRTEEDKGNPQYSSVQPLSSSVGIPARTLPDGTGQRNRCLFELARHLRSAMPNATQDELRRKVKEWHAMALPAIATKEFAVTWNDFLNSWDRVHSPAGATMAAILSRIDHAAQLPKKITELGYGKTAQSLLRICLALQEHHGAEPFFLPVRKAGELLNIHFTDAAKMLGAFVKDGVIELVSLGVGRVASRYRFLLSAGAG